MTEAEDGRPVGASRRAGSGLREGLARTRAWTEARGARVALEAALEVARAAPEEVVTRLASARRIVVTGAGSSYYIAQMAASAMRTEAALPAVAAPLSEVLLRPSDVLLADDPDSQPVLVVSRSGTTTEALDAIRATAAWGHFSVAVTCRPGSELSSLADALLAVPEGDEEAVVMTRSVAALATLLMRLGARTRRSPFGAALEAMPDSWSETAPHVERALELAAANPTRVVVLGGGAAIGLANEAVLKLTETSQVPAAAYHPLEFRHGPISVCEPGVLVVGLLGGPALAIERKVLDEAKTLGASTWQLGADGPGPDLPQPARLPLLLHPLQALALALAIRRGGDPDRPRHLGQVVRLSDRAADDPHVVGGPRRRGPRRSR